MKKNLFFIFISIFFLIGCNAQQTNVEEKYLTKKMDQDYDNHVDTNTCISPLFSFAYQIKGQFTHDTLVKDVKPSNPWTFELEIPKFPDDAVGYSEKEWLLSVFSKSNNWQNIWILRSWMTDNATGSLNSYEILAYDAESSTWISVPIDVKGTNVKVGELFLTENDEVWAHNYSGDIVSFLEPPYSVGIYQEKYPIVPYQLFSKYDSKMNQFVPVSKSEDIPNGNQEDGWSKVILDNNNVFWVLVQGDGLYKYSPTSQGILKHIDLKQELGDSIIKTITLDAENNIYLSDDYSYVLRYDQSSESVKKFTGFSPTYGDEYNTEFHGVLVDYLGRFWLGDKSWAEPEDYSTRYEIFPSSIFITRSEGTKIYDLEIPMLLLESDDNRLWYRFSNGLAWMSPEEEEWCWFTTYSSNIVEDSQGRLWIIADGKLYKNEINQ